MTPLIITSQMEPFLSISRKLSQTLQASIRHDISIDPGVDVVLLVFDAPGEILEGVTECIRLGIPVVTFGDYTSTDPIENTCLLWARRMAQAVACTAPYTADGSKKLQIGSLAAALLTSIGKDVPNNPCNGKETTLVEGDFKRLIDDPAKVLGDFDCVITDSFQVAEASAWYGRYVLYTGKLWNPVLQDLGVLRRCQNKDGLRVAIDGLDVFLRRRYPLESVRAVLGHGKAFIRTAAVVKQIHEDSRRSQ